MTEGEIREIERRAQHLVDGLRNVVPDPATIDSVTILRQTMLQDLADTVALCREVRLLKRELGRRTVTLVATSEAG